MSILFSISKMRMGCQNSDKPYLFLFHYSGETNLLLRHIYKGNLDNTPLLNII